MAPAVPDHVVSRAELARWLSGVHSFISTVNKPASLRELLDLVTATACDLLGYEFCGVLLLRPEQRRLVMEGSHGLSTEYVTRLNDQVPVSLASDPRGESPSTRAFLTARPVVVNDIKADPLMEPWWQLAEQQGYRSLVSVPLLVKGKPFGVINCYASDMNSFNESAVDLLGILANQAAGAIEAMHLRDQQRGFIETLAQANDSLRHQSAVLEQAEEIHKRLNEVALSNGGMEGVAHALEALLGTRVFIDDAQGQHVVPAGDWAGLHPNPEGMKVPDDLQTLAPVLGRRSGQGTWTVTPVRVSGETVARIWVPIALEEMDPLDRRAIEGAAVVAALEFLRLRTAQEVEWRVQGDILDVLMAGNVSEYCTLPPRAAQLGHDLGQPHAVIVLGPADVAMDALPVQRTRRMKDVIYSTVGAMKPRPLVARAGQHLVVLLPWTGDPAEAERAAEQLRSTAARALGTPTAGVLGPVCTELGDYGRGIRTARGALRVYLARGGAAQTVTLSGLGVLGLLLQLDRPEELTAFVQSRLGPLRDYDQSRSTALEETLRTFLREQCNVTATGKALFVHPNTVKMRLRRVEELLGIHLDRPDDLLDLRTAVTVDDVARGFLDSE